MPSCRSSPDGRPSLTAPECDAATRDLLLEMLAASSSNILLLPAQDVFGWRDRINLPGTVTDANWTWRLPWPVDVLEHQSRRARPGGQAGRVDAAVRS